MSPFTFIFICSTIFFFRPFRRSIICYSSRFHFSISCLFRTVLLDSCHRVCSNEVCAFLLSFGVGGVLAFVGFALVGIMFSFVPMTNVVVGRRLPDENRVSIFSILQSGVFLGLSVGALLGGILSDAVSPESAAGGALAVGALGLFLAIPLLTTRL